MWLEDPASLPSQGTAHKGLPSSPRGWWGLPGASVEASSGPNFSFHPLPLCLTYPGVDPKSRPPLTSCILTCISVLTSHQRVWTAISRDKLQMIQMQGNSSGQAAGESALGYWARGGRAVGMESDSPGLKGPLVLRATR